MNVYGEPKQDNVTFTKDQANAVDDLIGLKENVIIGKLIPAGTGMNLYRNIDLKLSKGEAIVDKDAVIEDDDTTEENNSTEE